MSTTEPVEPPPDAPAEEVCPHCGAPLRPDQEWCLNCGAAVTTEVAGAPAWRAPIAIVAAVLVVAAIALVIALVELSDDSARVASAPTPTPAASPPAGTTPAPETGTPTPTPSATLPAVPGASATPTPGATTSPDASTTPTPSPSASPTTSSTSSSFSDWPAGETAYTVVMWSARTLSEAESKATDFQSSGSSVGILNSDDYSSLKPGYFVVFSGQYDTLDAASSAAESARSTSPDAYPRHVKPK